MLVRSETRYVPTAVNMQVLQGEDGMYYYVHRSLYDQCVILRDQYHNLMPALYKLLGFEGTHPEFCDTFAAAVPEPLDILGPFLTLVTDAEKLEGIEEMCGALSSMSMSVDFRKMFKVPASVRASIKFSLSVREEYRVQWDRFFMETPTLEQVQHPTVISAPASVTTAINETADSEEEEEYIFTGGDVSEEELLAAMMGVGYVDTSATSADEEEEEEEEPEKAPSGFAMLKGLK